MLKAELKKPQSTLQIGPDTLSFFDRENGQRSALIQHREDQKIVQEMFSNDAKVVILPSEKKIRISTNGRLHVTNYINNKIGYLTWNDFPPVELEYPEKFSGTTSLRQMSLTAMWHRIEHPLKDDDLEKIKSFFYEKISLVLSPLLLILAAFPLGFLGKDSDRFSGFLLGLGLIFLVYYPLLIAGKNISLSGFISPAFALQLPNFVLIVIGLWGLKRLDARI